MPPHIVRQQFRVARERWPLLQIGPGILTVNDTEGYTWTKFRPLLKHAIEGLFESYPSEIACISPAQAVLRYLNALPFDPDNPDRPLLHFLRDKLHVTVDPDRRLFSDPLAAAKPVAANLNLTFPLDTPSALGSVSFATGQSANKPSIIWEITVRSGGQDVPQAPEELMKWLDDAHLVARKWFFTLARGEPLESFGYEK